MAILDGLIHRLLEPRRLWLFLDYDGTLADFAPTPEKIHPDPYVIGLLIRLVQQTWIRLAVISGRRLSQVRALLPVSGMFLAGTYGVELETYDGVRVQQVEYSKTRPVIESIQTSWAKLIEGRNGFFLEDKGYALALHARFADVAESIQVLSEAEDILLREHLPNEFRVLGGDKFLEICPKLANKGYTVSYLMERFPWTGALPVYIGDDDKDEEAFAAVSEKGGMAIQVARLPRASTAGYRLESPAEVHQLLEELIGGSE